MSVRKTPLLPASVLGDRCFLKYENLQTTGSFKIRGATEALRTLLAQGAKPAKVIAASAGNHGAGLAYAGRELGVPVELVVPDTTPKNKCERMSGYGARLHLNPGGYDESEARAKRMAKEESVPYISPYEDDAVIRGNGFLLGKEIHEQCPSVRTVVCPLGGGGMASGLGMYFSGKGIKVIGVSPLNNCAMVTSFETGVAQTSYKGKKTLAEGLEGSVAQKTYELCKEYNVSAHTVSENAIREAMVYGYSNLGVILEASAAVVLALYKTHGDIIDGSQDHVLILSGGNCDEKFLSQELCLV